jgi:hypothetical protein
MGLATLLAHSTLLPAHAVLTFQVASHTEPAPNQSQKATDETFPLVVTLGHQFLSTEAKGTRTIYDFERNLIRRLLAPAHVDVVDIFEGNTRLGISGQGKQGDELLLAALRADPYIAGAWHDLADRYYRTFRMEEAWSCMDAARRIAPSHPMLKSIEGLEQALRTRNPGYF